MVIQYPDGVGGWTMLNVVHRYVYLEAGHCLNRVDHVHDGLTPGHLNDTTGKGGEFLNKGMPFTNLTLILNCSWILLIALGILGSLHSK